MNPITDEIWIGSINDIADRDALRKSGIRSILCLDGCLRGRVAEDVGMDRIEIVELIDGKGNRPEVFMRAVRLLKDLRARHSPVLVHCHAGQSRSAAVVCKYLMSEEGHSLAGAMSIITAKRKVAIQSGLQEALNF